MTDQLHNSSDHSQPYKQRNKFPGYFIWANQCRISRSGSLKNTEDDSNTAFLLLVFSVTPFKIDQNKNKNRLIDKVQKLGNERRYISKDPRQDSGQRNISYTRYPKKCFTQIYRDMYGDAMLVLTWMSSNMADGNQQKHLLPSLATKA